MSSIIREADLEEMVKQEILKKEFKDTEVYTTLDDGTIKKEKRKCWVYETV